MERKKEKRAFRTKIILMVLLLLISAVFVYFEKTEFNPEYDSLKAKISEVSATAAKIIRVQEETNNYRDILAQSEKKYGNLWLDKDEYVSFLGEITLANNLNINKMTVGDVLDAENNMNVLSVKLELQGDLYNIKNFIQQLYDDGSVNRIKSFSFRLQSDRDYLWMWRGVDNEQLVGWWDLTGNEPKASSESGKEEGILDASELLAHGIALCYLEIEFLGTGG